MKIKNITPTALTLVIPCEEGCESGEDTLCTVSTTYQVDDDGNGNRGMREVVRHLPGAVTFLAGATVDVPGGVADSAPVKAAMARRHLIGVKDESKAKAKSGDSGSSSKETSS